MNSTVDSLRRCKHYKFFGSYTYKVAMATIISPKLGLQVNKTGRSCTLGTSADNVTNLATLTEVQLQIIMRFGVVAASIITRKLHIQENSLDVSIFRAATFITIHSKCLFCCGHTAKDFQKGS